MKNIRFTRTSVTLDGQVAGPIVFSAEFSLVFSADQQDQYWRMQPAYITHPLPAARPVLRFCSAIAIYLNCMNNYLDNKDEKEYFSSFKKQYHLRGYVSAESDERNESEKKRRIWLDGIELLPEMGHWLRQFYECAIGWGDTGGSAAFTTALTLCLSIFREERIAENLFIYFKQEIVQDLPDKDFEIYIDLTEFIKRHQSKFHPNLYSRFCYSSLINCREVLLYKDPESDEITANLAENYAIHNIGIPNGALRILNERKQRLIFRIFSKGKHVIKGYDFEEVMAQVEEVMSAFYWKSLKNVLKKQNLKKYKGL